MASDFSTQHREGAKLRECKVELEDGRRLVRQERTGEQTCYYAPLPRGLEWYSGAELITMGKARKRMEKVQ